MKAPRGFILYKIYYDHGKTLVYLGRTKQPLDRRMHGHFFNKPMHRKIDIFQDVKIEYALFSSEADMNVYEIYYINLLKPPLNHDDLAYDALTVTLPDSNWISYTPPLMDKWKEKLEAVLGDEKRAKEEKKRRLIERQEARKSLSSDDYLNWLEEHGF